jgi:hypothetical protein
MLPTVNPMRSSERSSSIAAAYFGG